MPFMPTLFGPKDEADLMQRVRTLAGRSVGEVARDLGREAPETLVRHKGFIGEIVEATLGAPRSSKSAPDFETLGIELKTIPVRAADGVPVESTYVCRVAPRLMLRGQFRQSRFRKKINRVLFVPVVAQPGPPGARRFGQGFLYAPTPQDDVRLMRDWEDFADLQARGVLDQVSARRGEVVQLRPKAPTNKARQESVDGDDETFIGQPRGFYLRPTFTAEIIARAFAPGASAREAQVEGAPNDMSVRAAAPPTDPLETR